ncbi:MAG: DUF3352 domain-containing protein [Bernardetiaceae bacterium]|nr:DUF3352 domain-containing protein [Bernardetiaceae bacterium]
MVKKFIRWALLLCIFIGLFLGTLIYFDISLERVNPMQAIPRDAMYIMRSDDPIPAWNAMRNSAVWSHLRTQKTFAEITKDADAIDELIKNNSRLFNLINNVDCFISAHPVSDSTQEYLYLLDMKTNLTDFMQDWITPFLSDQSQTVRKEYGRAGIFEIRSPSDTLYLHIHKNLLICAYNEKLVKNAIDLLDKDKEIENFVYERRFIDVSRRVGDLNGYFRLYINHAYLNTFANYYLDEPNEYIASLSKALGFTIADLSLSDDRSGLWRFEGSTGLNDSVQSFLNASLKAGRGDVTAMRVVPERSAFYISLSFESFNKFYEELWDGMRENDPTAFAEYERNIERFERFFGIDLQDDFFSWIGNEIAIIQTAPTARSSTDDEFAFVIKSNNISQAKRKLVHITERIRRRSPVKFRTATHRGYTISYMAVKGFFKLIMGKYFEKIERPYFTIIEDYVIFSNNPETLKNIIDDYELQLTLASSPEFLAFWKNFNKSSNIFAYVHTPTMFKTAKTWIDPETENQINKNKDYLVCFSQWGFQFSRDKRQFRTQMAIQFEDPKEIIKRDKEKSDARQQAVKRLDERKPSALSRISSLFGDRQSDADSEATVAELRVLPASDFIDMEKISIEDNQTKKQVLRFEKDGYEHETEIKDGKKHGFYKVYKDGLLYIEGSHKNDLPHGVWKYYDINGKVIERKRFRNGEEVTKSFF